MDSLCTTKRSKTMSTPSLLRHIINRNSNAQFITHHGQQARKMLPTYLETRFSRNVIITAVKGSERRLHQSRLKYGTDSRVLEFRSKIGFGGILRSISEREPTSDRLNGQGRAAGNVVTSSQGIAVERSRGEVASRDSTSLRENEMALPGLDAFGVDVLPVRLLWERPFPGTSKLVVTGTERPKPSSMSKCRVSIVYHNGDLRVGTWKGILLTAAMFLPQPPNPMSLPQRDDAYDGGCNAKGYVDDHLRLVRRC